MSITTISSVRNVYRSLTRAQYSQLLAIFQSRDEPLKTPICESLVALGLLRLDGNRYVVTDDGRYLAAAYQKT
jgi:hypothetical protein